MAAFRRGFLLVVLVVAVAAASHSGAGAATATRAQCTANERANRDAVVLAMQRAEAAHGAWAVYQDGDDADWATFYSAFLVERSPLAKLLGRSLTRADVTVALTRLDAWYTKAKPDEEWPQYYARRFCAALPAS